MKTHNRSNALLMELLIVILVFMLASTLLMQVFAKVRGLEDRAELTATALAEAQGQADRLYAAEDPEQVEVKVTAVTVNPSIYSSHMILPSVTQAVPDIQIAYGDRC